MSPLTRAALLSAALCVPLTTEALSLQEKSVLALAEQALGLLAAAVVLQGCERVQGEHELNATVQYDGSGRAVVDYRDLTIAVVDDNPRATVFTTAATGAQTVAMNSVLIHELSGTFIYFSEREKLFADAHVSLQRGEDGAPRELYRIWLEKSVTDTREGARDEGRETTLPPEKPSADWALHSEYRRPNGVAGRLITTRRVTGASGSCELSLSGALDNHNSGMQLYATVHVRRGPS